MRTYKGYEHVTVGDIPHKKLLKAVKTGKLSLSASDLKGGRIMLMHPENAKKVKKAKKLDKGIAIMITSPEIMSDIEFHDKSGGSLKGQGVWDWIKGAANSVKNFVSDNWDHIKPVLSAVADVGALPLATAVGAPELALPGRAALKGITGIGLKETRLANLAKARLAKKNKRIGGSFLLN